MWALAKSTYQQSLDSQDLGRRIQYRGLVEFPEFLFMFAFPFYLFAQSVGIWYDFQGVYFSIFFGVSIRFVHIDMLFDSSHDIVPIHWCIPKLANYCHTRCVLPRWYVRSSTRYARDAENINSILAVRRHVSLAILSRCPEELKKSSICICVY